MKITIAGTGYVGLITGLCYADVGHTVTCYDVNEEKIELLNKGESPIYEKDIEELLERNVNNKRISFTTDDSIAYREPDIIFIGVGTPERENGEANLDYVMQVCDKIALFLEKDCVIVVKSTVPIGTNDVIENYIKDKLVHNVQIEVVSNPEFLAQGSAIHDMFNADRIIIGTDSDRARCIMNELYKGFDIPIVNVGRRSAEMIKYASNDFLALKISYMNEIANLCDLFDANIDEVAKGMSYDSRIGNEFINAGIGYGGSCFPKDTKALVQLAKKHNYELKTVKAAIEVNEKQRLLLYNKALDKVEDFKDKKVAILGLTFKPKTDDTREAPAIYNVRKLLNDGADIIAYDPVGIDNFKMKISDESDKIQYTKDYRKALKGADICFVFTEWDEIKKIKPTEYKKYMNTPVLYDGRNIYNVDDMDKEGVEYYSVGRN